MQLYRQSSVYSCWCIVSNNNSCDGADFCHNLFTGIMCILPNGITLMIWTTGGKDVLVSLEWPTPSPSPWGNPTQEATRIHITILQQPTYILVWTDISACSLNLSSMNNRVQYDPPCQTNDYSYRCGSTTRAGRAIHVSLYLLSSERKYVEVFNLRGLIDMPAVSLTSTLHDNTGCVRMLRRWTWWY